MQNKDGERIEEQQLAMSGLHSMAMGSVYIQMVLCAASLCLLQVDKDENTFSTILLCVAHDRLEGGEHAVTKGPCCDQFMKGQMSRQS